MGEGVVGLMPLGVEYVVGEVVILVDNQVKLESPLLGGHPYLVELAHGGLLVKHALHHLRLVEPLVGIDERVNLSTTIPIEILFQVLQSAPHQREVEVQHQEAVPVLRGVFGHVETLEKLREVVLLVDVVVGLEHVEEQALAESSRADEEQEVSCLFHPLEIHGLVYQI